MNKPILLNEILRLKQGGLCFLLLSLLVSAHAVSAPGSKNDHSKEKAAGLVSSLAFARVTQEAESGELWAQFELGARYHAGEGTPQDYSKAVKWYRLAADRGDARAQSNLAVLYTMGVGGLERDQLQAAKLFEASAKQGHKQAQYNLGMAYIRGEGVPIDFPKALSWLKKSADLGYAPAQCDLGICFENGEGVKQDFKEATRWVRMAADQGLPEGEYQLGFYYYHGAGVPKDLQKALEWNQKAADQGYVPAIGAKELYKIKK